MSLARSFKAGVKSLNRSRVA